MDRYLAWVDDRAAIDGGAVPTPEELITGTPQTRLPNPPHAGHLVMLGLAFEGYTGGAHKEILDGLLSSGDAGYFDEAGRLFIDGRSDDMVISGGENVFPAEIENLLVARGDVRDAAVLGVADADFGQRLKAFVVPEPGSTPDADALRAYVKDNLARYKVPKVVVFLDELPRNATGKVLRARLLEHSDATEGAAGSTKSRG